MRIVHAREGKCETDATFPRGGGATRNWHYRNPEAMIYFFRMWKCHKNCACPQGGNTKRKQHFRFAEVQADLCSTACGTAQITLPKNSSSQV